MGVIRLVVGFIMLSDGDLRVEWGIELGSRSLQFWYDATSRSVWSPPSWHQVGFDVVASWLVSIRPTLIGFVSCDLKRPVHVEVVMLNSLYIY